MQPFPEVCACVCVCVCVCVCGQRLFHAWHFCFVLHRDANCLHDRKCRRQKSLVTHTLSSAVLTLETDVDKNISTQGSAYSLVVKLSSVPSHVLHLQMVSAQPSGFGCDGWRVTYVILELKKKKKSNLLWLAVAQSWHSRRGRSWIPSLNSLRVEIATHRSKLWSASALGPFVGNPDV